LSGFYRADLPDLEKAASGHGLYFQDSRDRDDWVAASFLKKQD
jgi:hypothetical protein